MTRTHRVGRACCDLVHRHQLVYNTCWEDPRLDREALRIGSRDTVVVITSAGCNALDYALDGPKHIHAVDLNPRQNALLDLKLAAIETLTHEDFFALFGKGYFPRWRDAYEAQLRPALPPWSQAYWDGHGHYFTGSAARPTFYFHGTTGFVARAVDLYLRYAARVRVDIDQLLGASSVDAQREVYERKRLGERLFGPLLRWALGRQALFALLAVPPVQRAHLEQSYAGGIAGFIQERIETVLTRLPIADNYFWRVYLTGSYAPDCCPEYLTAHGFARLKAGLVRRITTHTGSLLSFLRETPRQVTRLVLLDHMDWMTDAQSTLTEEWQAIFDSAAPKSRLLWRSGGTETAFVDRLRLSKDVTVGSRLSYDRGLAERLHALDRVNTYGSFHIAEVAA